MTPTTKKTKEKNQGDHLVEMFKDQGADSILVEDFGDGMCCMEPFNSKTQESWAMSFITSLDEDKKCKYPKYRYAKR